MREYWRIEIYNGKYDAIQKVAFEFNCFSEAEDFLNRCIESADDDVVIIFMKKKEDK